jgi:hypothetical protein
MSRIGGGAAVPFLDGRFGDEFGGSAETCVRRAVLPSIAMKLKRRDPARKAAPTQGWIDPFDEAAQPALVRNAVMEVRELPQKFQVMLAPGDDIVKIITGRDRGAGQQQDLLEGIHNAPARGRP